MKVCVAGASGAFGIKHLDAIKQIDGVEVTSIVGGMSGDLEGFAKERGIGHWTTDLNESLARSDVDAVILSTPTQTHWCGRRRRPAWLEWRATCGASIPATSGC